MIKPSSSNWMVLSIKFYMPIYAKYLSTVAQFLSRVIEPKSSDEDVQRHERILNTLLVGTIALSMTSIMASISTYINSTFVHNINHTGADPRILIGINMLFLSLYFVSRRGYYKIAAYLFLGIYLLGAFYTSYLWGINVPQSLLTYSLVIVMAGIIIGSKFAIKLTIFISTVIFLTAYLQVNKIISTNTSWQKTPTELIDVAIYVLTLSIITLVSWLSNVEIENSLARARTSEKELEKERDLLEMRIEERTKELKDRQTEKLVQLQRFTDLGRLSSGLIHDIANPLTVVSMNLEEIRKHSRKMPKQYNTGIHSIIKQAIKAEVHIENFIKTARKQIQKQEVIENFSPSKEIIDVLQVLKYKSNEQHVRILLNLQKAVKTHGDSVRFHQVVLNLVSNAIDAYEGIRIDKKSRKILISLSTKNNSIYLTVQDYGKGILKKHMSHIFDSLFTTKSFKKGTGIGLFIAKDIIENNFKGRISVKSTLKEGTLFTVRFPIRKNFK